MTRRKQKKTRRTHGVDQGANVPLNSVDAYLDSIALGEPQPYGQFRQLLLDKFPQLAKQFLPILGERSRDSEETMVSPYVVKNRDLDFSLTIASQFTGSQFRAYLRWFSETVDVKPRTIVDVGCDNGILTCFYASRFPEADVVGVDPHGEAIECATKLALRLNLANVRFHKASLSEFANAHGQGLTELITLTMLKDEHEGIRDTIPGSLDRMLAPETGRLVCFELAGQDFSSWIEFLATARLAKEHGPAALEFEHGGEGARVPATGCIMKRSNNVRAR